MVGGLMSGLSVAAASMANSIIYLYFFIGIIGGRGSHPLLVNTAGGHLERPRNSAPPSFSWGQVCVFTGRQSSCPGS